MSESKEKDGWREAIQRIEKAKQSGARKLELTGLDLDAIPAPVASLTALEHLEADNNRITLIPDFIAQLGNLSHLAIENNLITAMPDSLSTLKHLYMLELDNNQITAIPDSLANAASLGFLSLTNNQVSVIPNWLGRCTNLTHLFLYRNRVTAIPDSLADAVGLVGLYVSHNQITAIPHALSKLVHLKHLALGDNEIPVVPEIFSKLVRLQTLDLSNNQLSAMPASLEACAALRELNIRNNHIAMIPQFLGQLTNLEKLDFSDNQINVIPESLASLPNLKQLFLHGNPGLGIPDEVLGSRWFDNKKPKLPQEILDYVFSKHRPLNEAKLILVGQGGVGKTSLVKTLTGQKFKRGEKTTEGIKISDWACPLNRKDKITVHIWDFGGQEMMHATHQFFLTARSLYLLVLNSRPGGIDREADYWFRLVRAFGGKDAPVIVVLNKQKSGPFDVNRGGWLEKYSGNIRAFVETDCEDAKSITRLKKKIQEELGEMKSLQASFPERWFAIKDQLSQMSDQYVTYERYQEICKKRGEEDSERQTSLAGFLHDLGIALNYKDDPRLRFAYVLKPEWVTEGIYALLHAFVKNKGLFTRADAERVLKPKEYSAEAADFILGLMEQFEVSFPLGDNQKRSLIPQLLDDQQPDEARQFNPSKCLNFGYKYEIVPEGLLPRFIVRTHHISEAAGRWKSGVILHDPDTQCRALVRADSTAGMVSIHVDGPEQARRDLLAIIRYNFRVIHADYEFKPAELVYPPGVPERPQRLDDLEAFLRSDSASRVPIKLPDETVITPTVASLVEPVKETAEPLKLFLSYAHTEEKYVNQLRKDLKLMERNGLIRTWYDRALTAGEKWERRILQELNEADVIVCQISRDFLNSDFCVLKELDRAIQRKEAGEAELVAYLLEHCGWKEVPNLADFQVLPRDAKPMSEWKGKQDKYWRAIAEGIQEVIKKLRQQRPSRPSPESIRASAGRKA
jgi:internalin A